MYIKIYFLNEIKVYIYAVKITQMLQKILQGQISNENIVKINQKLLMRISLIYILLFKYLRKEIFYKQ